VYDAGAYFYCPYVSSAYRKERGAYTKGFGMVRLDSEPELARSQFSEEHITSGECPLWVISGLLRCGSHVRFTPESGH
jgi:hypothetical protein